MSEPFIDNTEAFTGEIVNNAGWHAAIEAFMMGDPHPKGYLSGSPAARISRALYAYEWAKREYPVTLREDGRWTHGIPKIGAAREAVLAKELTDK